MKAASTKAVITFITGGMSIFSIFSGNAFKALADKYPGISLNPIENGWQVVIPDSYRVGHEAHFGQVTENYLRYLEEGALPEWEVPNMITKYYTTTSAWKMVQ